MFCNNCGKEVNEQEKFCRYCGATITNSNAESNMSFDIILTNAGTNRIKVINVITETTGMSLKEAKEIVDNAPKTLKHNVTKETAEDIKAKLAEVGAGVELQHSIETSNSTESQVEVKTEEKPKSNKSKKKMWQTAFTINFTVVVMAIIVALALMDSDDSESTKSKTVATSTNPVETKNEVTKQNYIANSEKKTNEEKSQQTATKDNSTTATTNQKDTSSNSLVEASDVSHTGMRFKKTWSELKPQLDKYFENDTTRWVSGTVGTNITEYDMVFRRLRKTTYEENMSLGAAGAPVTSAVPFDAFYIGFVVEDNTDKVIHTQIAVHDDWEGEDGGVGYWLLMLKDVFSEKAFDVFGEYIDQVDTNDSTTNYTYRDGMYCYAMYTSPWQFYFLTACNDEEAQYHKQNGKWRNL